jgi:hypothetical protein
LAYRISLESSGAKNSILKDSFVVNPDLQEIEECDFAWSLLVVKMVGMVEGGGLEITERCFQRLTWRMRK